MGRQPTSGYCHTCRKRRVKCDRGRPACQRCLASGYRCGGYDLPLRMQILGIRSERDGTQRMTKIPTGAIGYRSAPRGPPPELTLVAFRGDMASSYFFGTFVWAPFWRSLLRSATSAAEGDPHGVNRSCFDALVYGYMGLGHGDASLQNNGRQLGEKPQLAKLAVTVIVMGMYEFAIHGIMGKSPPHHVGIIRILQHCGPDTFQDEHLLDVFRACRTLLICQALCRQSRCILEAEIWKTVPWRYTPKSFEDRLLDIFVELPGLAEDVAFPENRQAVREKIDVSLAALQTWRWDWHASYSYTVRWAPPVDGMDGCEARSPLFKHILSARLEFDSPTRALEILYYNAALLYLMQLAEMANGGVPPRKRPFGDKSHQTTRDLDNGPLLLPDSISSRYEAAIEALMTLRCTIRLLAVTDEKETVVTPAPLAILYWALQDLPEFAMCWDAIVGACPIFDDAQTVFAGYKVEPIALRDESLGK